MQNQRSGRNARPVGLYSQAVGRVVDAMLRERGLKVVDMKNDPRFTSNIYAMLKGDSIISVDDLKSMADFLSTTPAEVTARATQLMPGLLAEDLSRGDLRLAAKRGKRLPDEG